ncbi:hypothetical protein FOZ60_009686 [Perkinsus olseni]|uniref:Uncharacterized protein n=1 Tax=Perkinsus olseni TaxID=32597 RepID=A0A7J6PEP7_PEROL|nr:hypothetical protein FOZ60_009686 [Perkinsus olseni]
MSPSTNVLVLVAAVVLQTIDGTVPAHQAFETTFADGTCFMISFLPNGPSVRFFAACRSAKPRVFVSPELKFAERPENTFTLRPDKINRNKYQTFIGEIQEACRKDVMMQSGDMEEIIYEPGPEGGTLEASIGMLNRTFTPGKCSF